MRDTYANEKSNVSRRLRSGSHNLKFLRIGTSRNRHRWTLTPADLVLVMAKSGANRVDFALLLLFYRVAGFSRDATTRHNTRRPNG